MCTSLHLFQALPFFQATSLSGTTALAFNCSSSNYPQPFKIHYPRGDPPTVALKIILACKAF